MTAVSPRAARLALLCAALLFSSGGAAIKLSSLSGWSVAGWRAAIAAAFLLAASAEARSLRGGLVWLVGCAYAATTVLFVLANRETTAASTVFLQSTAPLYAGLFGYLWLRERPRRSDLATLSLFGVALVLLLAGPGDGQASAPRPVLGNALAATAGVTWGLTLTGLRRLAQSGRATLGAVGAGNLLAAALALSVAALRGEGPAAALGSARELLLFGWLGVFQIGLAYVLIGVGLRSTPVFQASLLLLVEPLLSPLWAWWVHGERVAATGVVAGVVVVVTCVWRATRAAGFARGPSAQST